MTEEATPGEATDQCRGEGDAREATEDTSSWMTERYMRLPDGSFPHLGIRGGGDVADVALLSGSPERVEMMASMLDDAERVGDRRGYAVFTGTLDGARLTVATSGVGSPSMAIAVEELAACGTSCFIRVGQLRGPVAGHAGGAASG